MARDDPPEVFIRFAKLPDSAKPLSIYRADPAEPIDATWLAVSHVPESPRNRETFVLYFLSETGEIEETLQYETLKIALDRAHALTGVSYAQWSTCELQVPEGVVIDPGRFLNFRDER